MQLHMRTFDIGHRFGQHLVIIDLQLSLSYTKSKLQSRGLCSAVVGSGMVILSMYRDPPESRFRDRV